MKFPSLLPVILLITLLFCINLPKAHAGHSPDCYRISETGVEYYREYFDPQFKRTSITQRPMPKADPATFEEIKGPPRTCWAKDRNHVYSADKIVDRADPADFHFLEHDYASDGQRFFYKGKEVAVDFPSFEIFSIPDENNLIIDAHDRNSLYFRGSVVKKYTAKPDPATFEALSRFFFRDRERVYRQAKTVKRGRAMLDLLPLLEADPESFSLLNSQGSAAKDRQRIFCYYKGDRRFQSFIPKDMKSFEFLNQFYAKDNKDGYFMGKEINGVDLSSFTGQGYFEARDQYRFYNRKGQPEPIKDELSGKGQ